MKDAQNQLHYHKPQGKAHKRSDDEPVLRLEGITKKYGAATAVENLTLDVHRGEILTLLGPSGCGKTTTLRMAVGLERAHGGTIIYNGRVVDSPADGVFLPAHRRNMGMVFQSYAIWPHMTVFENVAYPLRVRGRCRSSEVTEKVNRSLDLVGLGGFEHRPATQLSGGQMQRVAVARALVFGPNILLMDEPFSNLDAKLRESMRSEVKQLQRRLGITIVFVTHDQDEALSMSDRIAVINAGRLEQVGTPEDLYANPSTVAVRDFLGRTIKLNGRLESMEQDNAVVSLGDGTRLSVSGDGAHLHCQGIQAAGAACTLSIRPELIEVRQPGTAPVANEVCGKVKTLLFLGDRYEATIEMALGQNVIVYFGAAAGWSEGQAVSLVFPSSQLQLWSA